jgi:hypothetical protein
MKWPILYRLSPFLLIARFHDSIYPSVVYEFVADNIVPWGIVDANETRNNARWISIQRQSRKQHRKLSAKFAISTTMARIRGTGVYKTVSAPVP